MNTQSFDFRSPLANGIKAFLAYKRALGRRSDTEAKTLRLLDRYLVEHTINESERVTPALLQAFLASRPRSTSKSYNLLLGSVRRLFEWMVAHEMLPQSPLRAQPRRTTAQKKPFLFDKSNAQRLLNVATSLPDTPRAPLRSDTYRMIFALLYGLGLRVGEVSRLRWVDVDLENNLLMIRQTKFSKSRIVPLGPRMTLGLREYVQKREDRLGSFQPEHALFSFAKDKRTGIYPNTISWTFQKLVRTLDFSIPAGVRPPHLHCLRHSFAVGVLLRWYQEGIDPADRLFHLATFLGHVSPSSTAVYLTITDELLQEAGQRFEHFARFTLGER